MRSARRLAVFLTLVGLALAASRIWLPLYSVGPGPAREVEPLIHVAGRPVYASIGRFVMTSVTIQQLTALGALAAWLDPNRAVVGSSTLYAPGETPRQEQARATSQMDQSKLDAAFVVLKLLEGYPKDHGRGVLVEAVQPGCAADGRLYPGDLIASVDGRAVPDIGVVSAAIEAVPSGGTVRLGILAGGQRQQIGLVREPCGGVQRPVVGVSMIPNFPFRIQIQSGDVGGPSAGLMWALGLYDLLTPGDLTGGRMIAGTGQIGIDGTVYPIGGIAEKIAAAKAAGAQILLLPKGNLAEARRAGVEGIRLVPVATFDDAIAFLQGGA